MYCLCSVITLMIRQGHKCKKFFDTDTHARIDADTDTYIDTYYRIYVKDQARR